MFSNNNLVEYLINRNALKSNNIIEAFRHIDRKDFVLDPSVSDVYADYPLQIGYQQTISVKNSIYEVTKKEDDKLEGVEHYGFTFVPLIF